MIILKPGTKCRKRFKDKIDFDTLSLVYSILYDSVFKGVKKRNYTLNIVITAGEYSYYAWQKGQNVRVNISELIFDAPAFHRALLHEFRHFLQDKIYKIPLTIKNYNTATQYTYINSPVEIDANNFEDMVYYKAMRLYSRMLKAKTNFSKVTGYKGKHL